MKAVAMRATRSERRKIDIMMTILRGKRRTLNPPSPCTGSVVAIVHVQPLSGDGRVEESHRPIDWFLRVRSGSQWSAGEHIGVDQTTEPAYFWGPFSVAWRLGSSVCPK